MVKESWFSRLYDPALAPIELLGLRRVRREIVGNAGGAVLEVGAGTGRNLPHYRQARLVVATDPDTAMLRRARRRAAAARVPVGLLAADAQALPLPAAFFDTVVATCVLCTVPDPEAGLREIRRVLKPGGELRLLEHVRAPSPRLAQLQDRLTPVWRRVAGGCHLNRDTLESLRQAGFAPDCVLSSFRGVVVQARFRLRSD
jgi:ubiquinone/menaquinone biosynthesis C-methylase UbiE